MHIDVRAESIGRLSLASVDKPTPLRRRIRSSRRSPEVRRVLVVFGNCRIWTVPLAPSEACRYMHSANAINCGRARCYAPESALGRYSGISK